MQLRTALEPSSARRDGLLLLFGMFLPVLLYAAVRLSKTLCLGAAGFLNRVSDVHIASMAHDANVLWYVMAAVIEIVYVS